MVSFCLDVFFLGRGKKKALLQSEYRTSLDGQVHCMVFLWDVNFSKHGGVHFVSSVGTAGTR